MAETKKKNKNPLGVPETRGTFEIAGFVSGVSRENFYVEKNTKNNKPRRVLSFAVQYDKDQRLYTELAGMEQKSVYFSKKDSPTVEVPWRERRTFANEGYSLIGTRIGLETVVDKNGKESNKNRTLVAFDAAEYASQHLEDDMPVYVRGNISFSSFKDNNGDTRHSKKFEPNQISRSTRTMDFDAEKFEPVNNFTQRIVFMGIAKDEEKNRFILSAKIVTYSTIEDVEFIVEDAGFANTLRKHVKPYTAIDVFGRISVSKNEEESASESNGMNWGAKNRMNRKSAPTVIELIVEGADGDSLDTEAYSEDLMDAAIIAAKRIRDAKADYGDKDDDDVSEDKKNWGKGAKLNSSDDDEEEAW